MAIGSDGLGWIDFNNYELARTIGVVALALILFEGGLTAGFDEIRPVLRPSLSLAIAGTVGTAVICGFAAAWLFDLSTLEGMLLGAIISSTDGAAIFALLRESTLAAQARAHARGRGRLQRPGRRAARDRASSSGSSSRTTACSTWRGLFVREMGIGAVVGLAVGLLAVQCPAQHAAREPRALSGRHARHGRSCVRRRGDAARLRASSPPTWRG